MLVLIFGTYTTGKTKLIQNLCNIYNYKVITTYTTRPLRENDFGRKHLSLDQFHNQYDEFISVNEHFNHYYGIKLNDINEADISNEVYLLDFPFIKRGIFQNFHFVGIILLPEDLTELKNNHLKSNRLDRFESSRTEYETVYKNIDEKCLPDTYLLIKSLRKNFPDNLARVESIISRNHNKTNYDFKIEDP